MVIAPSASLFKEIQYDPFPQRTAAHAHLSPLYQSAKRINVTYLLLMLFIEDMKRIL